MIDPSYLLHSLNSAERFRFICEKET